MFITSKSSREYGNDCLIYKEKILTEIADLYQVTTITKIMGSWIDNDVTVQINEFESEDAAREYME